MRLFEHPDFDQAVIRAAEHFRPLGLREAIIEKDYFVTEALRVIEQAAGPRIIFKGKHDDRRLRPQRPIRVRPAVRRGRQGSQPRLRRGRHGERQGTHRTRPVIVCATTTRK